MTVWPFKRRPTNPPLVVPVEDENTLDRRRLLVQQQHKLIRAERLRERSSAVADDLRQENAINHYAKRLRDAYRNDNGSAHAH